MPPGIVRGARRRARTTAAGLMCPLLLLTACFPEAEPSASDLDCDEALGSPYTGDGGDVSAETVVMVDVSASMWDDGGEFPDFASVISERAVDADTFGRGGRRLLSVARFSGAESTPEYLLDRARIAEAVGTAEGRQQKDLDRVRDCVGKELTDLAGAPASGGSDVLAALSSATRKLTTLADSARAERRILVYTDGLVNTGCLDLKRYYGDSLTRDELIEDCAASREAPEAGLDGTDTTVFLQESPGHGLDTAQRGAVRDFWNQVCATYGAGDCATVPGEEAAPADTVEADPPEAADPEVMIPKAEFADRSELELPAQLLFAFDSATLLPSASSLIDEAVAGHGEELDRSVTVTGHTDSKGPAGYNEKLSRRRARAVAEYLGSLGFTDVTVKGRGESEPVCADDYDGAELIDPECAQRNRRVVIAFTE